MKILIKGKKIHFIVIDILKKSSSFEINFENMKFIFLNV
jgi:hypothetical protein